MKTRVFCVMCLILALLVPSIAFAGGAAEDETTMTMWHIQTQERIVDIIEGSLERFSADNPEYRVEQVPMQNDPYKTTLIISMGADEMPDMFIHWTGGPMISYIEEGALYDLTELMEADGYKDQFLDAAIEQVTYEDSLWAVPVENVTPAFFFYNEELFDEYGLDVPETFEEFEAVSEVFMENDIIPVALANRTKWTGSIFYAYVLNRVAGAEAFADAYDGNRSFEDEDFLKAASIVQDWANRGFFGRDFNALDYDAGQDRQLLYNDNAAMYVMGSWFIFTALGESPDYMDKVGIAEFPVYEGGKGKPTDFIGTVGDNFFSISSSSENPEMAFEAITYLLDDIAVEERKAAGKIPPLKNMTFEDETDAMIYQQVEEATHIQLWLDQYLPPEEAELHKDESQRLFGGSITPEEYNRRMQEGIHGR